MKFRQKMPTKIVEADRTRERREEIYLLACAKTREKREVYEESGSNTAFAEWKEAAAAEDVAHRRLLNAQVLCGRILRELRTRRVHPRKTVPLRG